MESEMSLIVRRPALRAVLLGAAAATALTATTASAQTQPTGPGGQVPSPATQVDTAANPNAQVPQGAVQGIEDATDSSQPTNDIVVTGIRASLQSATNAKRNSVGFGDSIFAEDIGKLPATNLAETLNRIPGVRLNRDISGEGTQVSIRGLGPSFSKVLLNGTQFAVASDGGTNGTGGGNREVDLDFFPSELFTRLDVAKSATASTLEGGIAGTVNLRNARPFDKPGTHVTVVAQGAYTDTNDRVGPRGALVASHTFGDTFGILVGVAGVRQKTRIDGYDTVGFTDANLALCQPATGACNPGGNGFSFATSVPANVGRGLVTGAPVDLAATSGLPLSQLATAILPRLGRPVLTEGTRERISAIGAMEWRPSDALHFALDGIYAKSKRNYLRSNMNWQVRNSGPGTSPQSTGGMVPFDVEVDQNNVVTSGTFANSSFFSENSFFNQDTEFWNVTPSASWRPSDMLKIDLSANWGKSNFFREQPTFAFQTAPNSGVEVTYDNTTNSPQPIISANRDLGDPNLGWQWYRVNVSNVRRETETKGAHLDLMYGNDALNVKFGAAYDEAARSVRAFDNTPAFQASVCGATCDGNSGSVPTGQIAQYLNRGVSNFGKLSSGQFGVTSFIIPDLNRLAQATNYAQFRDNAPEVRGSVTGGATGDVFEKVYGGYFEVNGVSELFGRELRANAGFRYVWTDQRVVGPSQIGNSIIDITADSNYEEVLPSANISYDLFPNLKLRFAVSKTLTRPDAGSILPGVTFSDPSAQIASAGNPTLQPYTSDNIDLGGEFYTGGAGYVGVSLFRKSINGFTATIQEQATFGSLNIPFSSLIQTQQNALTDRARAAGLAVDATPVSVNRPVNLQTLVIKGIEGTWNQPLDFVVKGLGFQANGTHITQDSDPVLIGGTQQTLFAPGVPRWGYNVQGYYENYGLSLSLNYVWQGDVIAANAPQNNLNVPLRADARGQLDLSAGYQLPFLDKAMRLTLDVLNITNKPLRTTIGYDNAAYSVYYPGRQVLVGLRASF